MNHLIDTQLHQRLKSWRVFTECATSLTLAALTKWVERLSELYADALDTAEATQTRACPPTYQNANKLH